MTTLDDKVITALHACGDVMTTADLLAMAQARKVQIWGDAETWVATEILEFPRKRIMSAFLAAGSLRGILAQEHRILDFARAEECSAIIADGAAVWGRIGRSRGWRPHSIRFVLPLEEHPT